MIGKLATTLRTSLVMALMGGKGIQRQGRARDYRHCNSKYKPHRGSNETIRRKRQIERGMLKVS